MDRTKDMISELDTLIEKVRITTVETENDAILQEDDKIPETDTKLTGSESEDESVQDLNQTKDLELAKAMEEIYMTSPQTDDGNDELPCAFYVLYQYKQKGKAAAELTEPTRTQLREASKQAQEDWYAKYGPELINLAVQGAFTAGRMVKDKRLHKKNLPDELKLI